MPETDPPALRCAVHPALPAVDTCPVCRRPRCANDAALAPGGGCLTCEGVRPRSGPPPLDLRALVGAGVLCGIVTPVVGKVASEYVGAGWVGWTMPVFAGVAVAIAAEAGARRKRGRLLRIVAAVYSVLAIAVGLADPRAAGSPFTPVGRVLGLYALAAATAWFWTAPPRVVARRDD